jgi:hypothetical protein
LRGKRNDKEAVMMAWESKHPLGPNVFPADVKFPNQEPQWDNNDAVHWGYMRELRDLIIKGIPGHKNIARAFDVQQGKEECSAEFLNRLKKQVRKYSGLNVEDSLGQGMLKLCFVSNIWPNIAKKIQKFKNWKDKNMTELLREAQKVYTRRDEENQDNAVHHRADN